VADRSQFWKNVDATKPEKLSRLSVRQLRDYQNYFLEVQGDYNPALPPHENTVASERLTLLRDEIGSRRGKRRPAASVAEQRHKQVIFWMKIAAAVAAGGVLVTIIAVCHTSSPPSPPRPSTPNTPAGEQLSPPATQTPIKSAQSTATPSPFVSSVPYSPITFAEMIRVESDNTLTDLQKDEFRRKHQGKIVEWTVRVLSVQRQWEREDSDFNVVFRSPDVDESRFGETGVATFPASLRDDMVDLRSGDIIRIRGVVKFIGPVHYLVVVNNCQLLEHHK
jgi:hypothetical protein